MKLVLFIEKLILIFLLLSWMVWSDWGKVARIERAGMDGSHRYISLISTIEIALRMPEVFHRHLHFIPLNRRLYFLR